MTAEPDWDEPVQITEPLASALAQAISKGMITDLAMPQRWRSPLGTAAAAMLRNLWAKDGLTVAADGRVGMATEPAEQICQGILSSAAEIGELRKEWANSLRERLRASGLDRDEIDELMGRIDAAGHRADEAEKLLKPPPEQ